MVVPVTVVLVDWAVVDVVPPGVVVPLVPVEVPVDVVLDVVVELFVDVA